LASSQWDREIDTATPPEVLIYLKSLSPETRLSLEEKLFDATRTWQSGLLLFYQPVIDTPLRTYAWMAVKKFGWFVLGLPPCREVMGFAPLNPSYALLLRWTPKMRQLAKVEPCP
jgi:hypothetical protein